MQRGRCTGNQRRYCGCVADKIRWRDPPVSVGGPIEQPEPSPLSVVVSVCAGVRRARNSATLLSMLKPPPLILTCFVFKQRQP